MNKKPRRILLTGSTGQVGWELHRSLKTLGETIAPSRDQFDLSNPESLREKIQEWKPDLIVNPAAFTAVEQAEEESELAIRINATAPRVMAEEAEKLSIPLIHYSTDYVFDGKKTIPYTEEDEPNPINMYGESKLLGEQAIQETLERQLILRTSWVYSHRGNNFLNTILRLLQERDEIKVVDDQIGAPTSARLIAESTEKLLRNSIQGYGDLIRGTYHLTAGGSTSWYGFAREILTTLNASIKTSILPISSSEYVVKARRPSMSVLDNHKMISNTDVGQPDWKHDMVLEMSLNFMI